MAKHSVGETPTASVGPVTPGSPAPAHNPSVRRNVRPGTPSATLAAAALLGTTASGQPGAPEVDGEPAAAVDVEAERIVSAVTADKHGPNCIDCQEHVEAVRAAAQALAAATRAYVEHRYGKTAAQPLGLVTLALSPGAKLKARTAMQAAARGDLLGALVALR